MLSCRIPFLLKLKCAKIVPNQVLQNSNLSSFKNNKIIIRKKGAYAAPFLMLFYLRPDDLEEEDEEEEEEDLDEDEDADDFEEDPDEELLLTDGAEEDLEGEELLEALLTVDLDGAGLLLTSDLRGAGDGAAMLFCDLEGAGATPDLPVFDGTDPVDLDGAAAGILLSAGADAAEPLFSLSPDPKFPLFPPDWLLRLFPLLFTLRVLLSKFPLFPPGRLLLLFPLLVLLFTWLLLEIPAELLPGLVLLVSEERAAPVSCACLSDAIRVLCPLTVSLRISELLVLLFRVEPVRVEYSRELYLDGE